MRSEWDALLLGFLNDKKQAKAEWYNEHSRPLTISMVDPASSSTGSATFDVGRGGKFLGDATARGARDTARLCIVELDGSQ